MLPTCCVQPLRGTAVLFILYHGKEANNQVYLEQINTTIVLLDYIGTIRMVTKEVITEHQLKGSSDPIYFSTREEEWAENKEGYCAMEFMCGDSWFRCGNIL